MKRERCFCRKELHTNNAYNGTNLSRKEKLAYSTLSLEIKFEYHYYREIFNYLQLTENHNTIVDLSLIAKKVTIDLSR